MPRLAAGFAALVLISAGLHPPLAQAQDLKTVAESSDYKATSRYADVVAFCDGLAKASPLVKVTDFGTTHEGRKLPLLVLADPPVATPAEAAQSGKLVVLVFANIHAGEVDGKEAVLALARDIATKKGHPLLKELVILVAPILNADGNERIDPKNRGSQNGPEGGVGIRANAQGLDLNRDFVKLESPEVRGLVKLLSAWDPAVIIDCHTTNGSRHRYGLTHDGPRYPLANAKAVDGVAGRLLPDVAKRVKASAGYEIAPYGNFNPDRTKWETYPGTPRYGVQYFAARGRVGLLSESYSYATFKDRVKASYAFVEACLTYAAGHGAEVKGWAADEPRPRIPLRTKAVAFPDKLTVLGFEEELKDGKRVATDKPKDYALEFVGKVDPTLEVDRPFAYLVLPGRPAVVENLQRHGVKLEELREDVELDVETYTVAAVDQTAREFEKHKLVTVEAKAHPARRLVPAGTVVVKTAQPLGTLAAYLLEPMAEDGLTTWGFFEKDLMPGKDFPVLRMRKDAPTTRGGVRPLADGREANKPITEVVLTGGGRGFTFGFAGNPAAGFAWLPDGEHFLQPKDGKLLKVHARTGRAEPFVDAELLKKSLTANGLFTPLAADRIARGVSFRFSADKTAALFDIGSDYAIGYFDGRPAVRLTKSEGPKDFVTLSPDGGRIAYVRGGNLFAASAADPGEKQLTTDGGGDILNGRGDWVYEEEIFNRAGQTYWWSPDGKQLAFMRFDDTPVRRFNIVDLRDTRGRLEIQPYPKVGDPNPTVKLGVAPAAGGKPVFLDMGDYPADKTLVSRVGWLPDSKGVYAYVQDRYQTWLDFVVWESPDAKPKKLFRDTTKAWIDDAGPPHFLPDGSFLFSSERTGWKHLYLYAADGTLRRAVTAGEWEARDVLRVDAEAGAVYVAGTKDGSTVSHVYRAKLDGSGVERVTPAGGTHQVTLAPKGPLYIDRYTDNDTPTKVFLNEMTGGRVRTLDTNPVYEREEFRFGRHERVQVPMKDGFVLEGAVTYPPNFDPAKKYPVWVLTYAGPHTPTVRDGWGGGRIFEQTLATSGIIAFRVDPRSASGKGAASAWACYKQLGVQELKDLEEAVGWLCENPWADARRVGISGHSYGGFMAAYALTHSKAFSAGIAGAPVTDWKLYDTIYTERYMLTPKENPDGYDKSSCVRAARNLHGRLLIVHGMIDDNVHMQNTAQFVHALQLAGKDFEMMLYPQARHGIPGPHYMRLQLDFIRRTMGVGAEKK